MQLFLYRTEKIKKKEKKNVPIALFTVTPSHLHDNVFELARNCLTSTFKYVVMQMRKGNCEKGYCTTLKEYS